MDKAPNSTETQPQSVPAFAEQIYSASRPEVPLSSGKINPKNRSTYPKNKAIYSLAEPVLSSTDSELDVFDFKEEVDEMSTKQNEFQSGYEQFLASVDQGKILNGTPEEQALYQKSLVTFLQQQAVIANLTAGQELNEDDLTEPEVVLKKYVRPSCGGKTNEKKPIRCNYQNCNKLLMTEKNYFLHISNHPTSKNYKCGVCSREFDFPNELINHGLAHTTENLPQCYICSKRLADSNNYDNHMKLHSRDKPHRCEECGSKFRTPAGLHAHKTHHDVDKKHICGQCGKAFSNGQELKSHITVHEEDRTKLHGCDVCGKRFSKKPQLSNHYKRHTSEPQLRCPHCDRRFWHSKVLKNHVYIHTGEKPWECKTCGKHFRQQVALHQHLVVHTGERKFACPVCKVAFKYRSQYHAHKRRNKCKSPVELPPCLDPPQEVEELQQEGGEELKEEAEDIIATLPDLIETQEEAVGSPVKSEISSSPATPLTPYVQQQVTTPPVCQVTKEEEELFNQNALALAKQHQYQFAAHQHQQNQIAHMNNLKNQQYQMSQKQAYIMHKVQQPTTYHIPPAHLSNAPQTQNQQGVQFCTTTNMATTSANITANAFTMLPSFTLIPQMVPTFQHHQGFVGNGNFHPPPAHILPSFYQDNLQFQAVAQQRRALPYGAATEVYADDSGNSANGTSYVVAM